MKLYKTKSKMKGYEIGMNDDKIYVAVPEKYLLKEAVLISFDGKTKLVTLSDKVGQATFLDKFKPTQHYTLCYFLWE